MSDIHTSFRVTVHIIRRVDDTLQSYHVLFDDDSPGLVNVEKGRPLTLTGIGAPFLLPPTSFNKKQAREHIANDHAIIDAQTLISLCKKSYKENIQIDIGETYSGVGRIALPLKTKKSALTAFVLTVGFSATRSKEASFLNDLIAHLKTAQTHIQQRIKKHHLNI